MDDPYREIQALQERLSRLSAASLRINESLDFDQVLQGVLDSARFLTGARYGVMTLLDDAGWVQDFLSSGLTAEESGQLWLMPEGLRIFQALTNVSEPMRTPDLTEHVGSLGFGDFAIPLPVGVFPFLSVPMFHREARVGHVFVGCTENGGEFTQEDEDTLVMFASQAALVIANARTHRGEWQARADLETLVSTAPVGVVVFDATTGFPKSINREAMRIVDSLRDGGQPAEGLLEVVTCVRSDGREVSLRELPLAEALGAGETVRAEEIALRVPDGRSVSALLNATPIHGEDGQLASFVVTLQDLTPLEEQERLRADFLAMVSHELRTPLAAVKGSVDTLVEAAGKLDPAEMAQFFTIIQEQADQMRHLIGDLLDVARIQTGTLPVAPEPTDLRTLVEEAGSGLLTVGARNALEVALAEDLPWVMADRRRVAQVLSSLLANAVGNSPEGAPILVSAVRDGVYVSVTVSDRGRGIPAELMPALFRRFSPGHDQDEFFGAHRSGLSLAICKGIVEAHGGRIRAESDGPGLGSRFTFTVPAVEETALTVHGDLAPVALRRDDRARVRVLVVDDDPQALRYAREALAGAGYAPIVTDDPADVSRLVAEAKPHLALLDLALPSSDRLELMIGILKKADVPVIFLSAYGRDEVVAHALELGAADYVAKPFSPGELDARIRVALRKRVEPAPGEPSVSLWFGDLSIDFAERLVTVDGQTVDLTSTEYAVLYELAVNAPRVLPHNVLLQRVWGPERMGDAWLVRDVVKVLRRKLGDSAQNPRYIFTEPRVGYRMAAVEGEQL